MTTILLVDDEQLVLRSLEKTLLRVRFHVLTASNCVSGWKMFQTNAESIDMAIFDLNMPDFDGISRPDAGLELMQRIVAIRPDLPVVVLTAYDEVGKAKGALQLGARAFFVKGREQGLVNLVQEILSDSISK
ncbi:MAG TPA: response regulator [Anaerolineales bacterium]|nr:response regulator [Anaerolineales bacterium]